MCSSTLPQARDISGSEVCAATDTAHHHHHQAFRRVACSFCSLPANAHAPLPPLPRSIFSSCTEQLGDVGVFVHAGESTMTEASRAALAATRSLPPANVFIATDLSAGRVSADFMSMEAGVAVVQLPDDDDGAHSGGYGASAPWKKAQSRFPHALAAAVARMPRNVKWIISQDSDTALNIPAIAAILATQDYSSKVIFGCVYEHVRQSVRKAHHGGGAGMIFSRAAAESIVDAWQAHLPHSAPRYMRCSTLCIVENVLKNG
jgi:hypothetical protein